MAVLLVYFSYGLIAYFYAQDRIWDGVYIHWCNALTDVKILQMIKSHN